VRRQGLEPRARGLRADRCGALSALPARMRRLSAQKAPIAQTVGLHSFHDSFHEGTVSLEALIAKRYDGDRLLWRPVAATKW
jgi:hypothetical protein